MNTQFCLRTEEKLSFADVHLDELRSYKHTTSNDCWERAHQESVLFHLAGAVDAILHEINVGYSLGLDLAGVHWRTVRKNFLSSSKNSPAFDHLQTLRKDTHSWLTLLFELRNHGTHRGRLAKRVHLSNHRTVDNEFIDPRTGHLQTVYPGFGCLEILERFRNEVRTLIEDCRRLDPLL